LCAFAASIAILALVGAYRVVGLGEPLPVVLALLSAIAAGTIEEIVFRRLVAPVRRHPPPQPARDGARRDRDRLRGRRPARRRVRADATPLAADRHSRRLELRRRRHLRR